MMIGDNRYYSFVKKVMIVSEGFFDDQKLLFMHRSVQFGSGEFSSIEYNRALLLVCVLLLNGVSYSIVGGVGLYSDGLSGIRSDEERSER